MDNDEWYHLTGETMNDADEKMKDDFYDWLNECPVNWVRLKVNDETIHYAFETPDEAVND